MNFSQGLIRHAIKLLPSLDAASLHDVDMRRAVSASYYALFHHITASAVATIAPNVPLGVDHRIQRWFQHHEMKSVCIRFGQAKLDKPLRDLIGEAASADLQMFVNSFVRLQEARHSADYDLSYALTWINAKQFIEMSVLAIGAWERIQGSAEVNIFVLSLLLWKNWDNKRP